MTWIAYLLIFGIPPALVWYCPIFKLNFGWRREVVRENPQDALLLASDPLLEEFHRAKIFLPEEIARARVGREILFDGSVTIGGVLRIGRSGDTEFLADQARRQGYLAEALAQQDLQRNLAHAQDQNSQLLATMAQDRFQHALMRGTPDQQRDMNKGLLSGLGGGIGALGGGIVGVLGQALTRGGPARFGDD